MALPFVLMSTSESQWSLTCGQKPEGMSQVCDVMCVYVSLCVYLSERAAAGPSVNHQLILLAISALSRHLGPGVTPGCRWTVFASQVGQPCSTDLVQQSHQASEAIEGNKQASAGHCMR